MDRQKALEDFLGDRVYPETLGLYLWRDRYYEVVPHRLTLKRHNWSGFTRLHHKGKTWMMREASDDVVKKYYPQIWNKNQMSKALKYNPELIKKA